MPTNNRNYPPSPQLQARFLDAMPEDRWTTAREMAAVLFHNRSYARAILNHLAATGQISIVNAANGLPHLYRRPLPNRTCNTCQYTGPESDFNRDYRHDTGIRFYPGCKKCRNPRENTRRRTRQETSQPS